MTKCRLMRAELFMLATVCLSAAASAKPQSVWRVEDGGNGHVYGMIYAPTATWDESVGYAHAVQAHLATFSSEAEASWVYENVVDSPIAWAGPVGPWFGAVKEGKWRWIDGTSWEWDPWSYGFCAPPNDNCDEESTVLHFRNQAGIFTAANQWEDIPSSLLCGGSAGASGNEIRPMWFVVEWDEDCNLNGKTDKQELIDNQALDVNANQILDACECLADLTGDGSIDSADIVILLDHWGLVDPGTLGDYNQDGLVDHKDLMTLLNNWGPCNYCYSC